MSTDGQGPEVTRLLMPELGRAKVKEAFLVGFAATGPGQSPAGRPEESGWLRSGLPATCSIFRLGERAGREGALVMPEC